MMNPLLLLSWFHTAVLIVTGSPPATLDIIVIYPLSRDAFVLRNINVLLCNDYFWCHCMFSKMNMQPLVKGQNKPSFSSMLEGEQSFQSGVWSKLMHFSLPRSSIELGIAPNISLINNQMGHHKIWIGWHYYSPLFLQCPQIRAISLFTLSQVSL